MRTSTAQTMRLFYYAATSFMDYSVGKLLSNLESTGLKDETVVIFTSDHGWTLGENGDWLKFVRSHAPGNLHAFPPFSIIIFTHC